MAMTFMLSLRSKRYRIHSCATWNVALFPSRFLAGRKTQGTHAYVINLTLSWESRYFPCVSLPGWFNCIGFLEFYRVKWVNSIDATARWEILTGKVAEEFKTFLLVKTCNIFTSADQYVRLSQSVAHRCCSSRDTMSNSYRSLIKVAEVFHHYVHQKWCQKQSSKDAFM